MTTLSVIARSVSDVATSTETNVDAIQRLPRLRLAMTTLSVIARSVSDVAISMEADVDAVQGLPRFARNDNPLRHREERERRGDPNGDKRGCYTEIATRSLL